MMQNMSPEQLKEMAKMAPGFANRNAFEVPKPAHDASNFFAEDPKESKLDPDTSTKHETLLLKKTQANDLVQN